MALGEFSLFQWKNKEAREREQKEYSEWAFPHGPDQRKNLEALMRELRPRERVEFMLMGFLTCKELYERYLKKLETKEKTLYYMIHEEKKYKQIIEKKDMTTHLALVLADAEVDEQCVYPSADEIRASIKEIDELYLKRRK